MSHSFLTPFPSGGLRRAGIWLAAALLGTGLSNKAAAQSFLQASGPKIVNASNQEVILRGVNLGGWQVQEGYMMKPGYSGTQGSIKKYLFSQGQSDGQVESFYQQWRDNFITKADIDYLKDKGFNCVRLPLHYELFLTASQRAVRTNVSKGATSYGDYLNSLRSWYNGNQLFTDASTLEGVRLIDEVLSWAGGNGMYVVLDLHAAPGAQGSDTNISDALVPGGNDFWNNQINQDVANRLWQFLATRYKGDPRVAMYDVLNEPNNIPNTSSQNGNQRLHDVLQRFINTIRAAGDNHLILLEGNGFGNDYNYMEKRTFSNTANLVYNSHRYSGSGYEIDNNPNSVDGNNANSLRLIGNLTRFRSDNNVPIWVGETGENSAQWMSDAAKGLNQVGIGYCHWTLKRFENGSNAALFHINPPYLVDGAGNMAAVLQNIKQPSNVLNSSTLNAVAPNPGGAVRNTKAPIGKVITLKAVTNGGYLSSENGQQAVTCTRPAAGTWEQFTVLDAGNGKVYLRAMSKYLSSENGTQALTCNRTSPGWWEAFDWIVNADGTVSLGGYNGRYVSGENGTQAATCTRMTISGWEAFSYSVVGNARLAAAPTTTATSDSPAASEELTFYPNPVTSQLTYALPQGLAAHALTITDATGRVVLSRSYGSVGRQNTFDASALASGLYLVRLSGSDYAQSFKFTKQ